MRVHVHVYSVVSKAEVDCEVRSKKDAMRVALARVESGKVRFGKSDCKYLAMVPKSDPKEKSKIIRDRNAKKANSYKRNPTR